ncbi:hypothetical protein EV2_000404 [Malus domestica]
MQLAKSEMDPIQARRRMFKSRTLFASILPPPPFSRPLSILLPISSAPATWLEALLEEDEEDPLKPTQCLTELLANNTPCTTVDPTSYETENGYLSRQHGSPADFSGGGRSGGGGYLSAHSSFRKEGGKTRTMVSLKLQKRLASSVLKYGRGKLELQLPCSAYLWTLTSSCSESPTR